MQSDRRRLIVGFGVLVVLAGLVGVLARAGRAPAAKPEDVVVGSSPGAHVALPQPGTTPEPSACTATPSTGDGTVVYRVGPDDSWAKLDLTLCHPPGYRPGGVALSLRSPEGAVLQTVIPAGGWIPNQNWRGADAQIELTLMSGRVWRAEDAALPCRMRTSLLRRFFAPITSFYGEQADGTVLVGASVRASFECSKLPLIKGGGAPVDLRGELTIRNCEGIASVVPPPRLSARCDDA